MAQTVHLKLKIDGNDIAGESTIASLERADTIECSSFKYSLVTPREEATAMLTGKRQHKPVKITKRIDQTTPLLLKALCNNEPVNEALFMFYRPSVTGAGVEEKYFTVKLENGFVATISQRSEDAITCGEAAPPMMEEIGFVFQDITWTYEINGATHHDSWKGEV
jgi:type VI secretion system secreted protein Hcp